MDETKFRETETKYEEIKEKHAKGEISTEQVKAELKRLMVQDETGTYWMLGGKSGKWYRHDGAQWQETDPYEIIKAVAEAEEAPMELDALAKISQEQEEEQIEAQKEEQEEEEEEENPFESTEVDAADAGELSYPTFATETAGTVEGADDASIPVTSPGTESAETPGAGDTTITADTPPVSNGTYSAETIEAPAADIPLTSDGTESAEPLPTADKASNDAGGVEDSTYGSYDTFGTYEIDTTEADETEAADAADESILIERGKVEDEAPGTGLESLSAGAADGKEIVDTQKFEYTSSGREEAEPVVTIEPTMPEAPVTPEAPAVESQDYISCGVCKSRIPPYAIYCTFCGAHQKTLKQPTPVKSIKEESELLVKSIKITSFLFFLGGLGLILGVILGATFGVVKDFFSGLSSQLPMMLSETRGGLAGGLIFAAIGGIGGFILSAILSTILAGGYNLVAYIFGGIRFKVKR
jgi:hypothetical protein